LAKQALEDKNWLELLRQSTIVIKNFPSTAFALDSYYSLGVAYFHMNELDLANQNFSLYLKKQTAPKFFEQTIEYKFQIAQSFEKGAKRHLMGIEGLPKWMPARQEAIALYDEVIMALPQHDLAVQSLFGKAGLLLLEEEFKSSIETYQTLIRRFPKHPLAIDSYVAITSVYLTHSQTEYLDPDYLDLAEINVKKFKMDFPGDPLIGKAEELLLSMKELYAKELYETAQFYERTKKPSAAVIYYTKILGKYPLTHMAKQSEKRLQTLGVPDSSQKEIEPLKPVEGMLVEAKETAS
jgi:outer membrane protein assembly factor BamD (BamD/ComL family)